MMNFKDRGSPVVKSMLIFLVLVVVTGTGIYLYGKNNATSPEGQTTAPAVNRNSVIDE